MDVTPNQEALLALAARCKDRFALQMPHAPGAFAFGALVDPASFGLTGPVAGTGGRGLTKAHAFESCMGETAEYLSFLSAPDDPRVAQDDTMEARGVPSDKVSRVPAGLVLRRFDKAAVTDSTGVGAGPTHEAARQSAMFEVVERDAVALWWFGGHPGWALDLPGVTALAAQIRDGQRRVWFLDITTDIGVPTVVCLSSAPDGTDIVAGAASALSFEAAGRSALLETCQMELARDISLSRASSSESQHVADTDDVWQRRRKELSLTRSPWLLGDAPAQGVVTGALNWPQALQKIHAAGLRPVWVDLTLPSLKIPVVRMIADGAQTLSSTHQTQRLEACRTRNPGLSQRGRGLICPI